MVTKLADNITLSAGFTLPAITSGSEHLTPVVVLFEVKEIPLVVMREFYAETPRRYSPLLGPQSGSGDEGGSEAESEVDELVLPAAHALAAGELLAASPAAPLSVRDVALPTLEERVTLAHALWDIGAVGVVA